AQSVRIPRDLQRTGRNIRRQQAELAATLGRFPTTVELAVALDVDAAEIERAVVAERAGHRVVVAPEDDSLESSQTFEPFAGSDDRMLLAASMRVLGERE